MSEHTRVCCADAVNGREAIYTGRALRLSTDTTCKGSYASIAREKHQQKPMNAPFALKNHIRSPRRPPHAHTPAFCCTFCLNSAEYLYQVLVGNGCPLPPEALYIIRFHSFYAHHQQNAYAHFCNNKVSLCT